MVNCPACLPPDNFYCATCNGNSMVTKEIADNFLIKKEKNESAIKLISEIKEKITNLTTVEEIRSTILEIIEI